MPSRHPASQLQLPSLKTTAGLQPGVVFFQAQLREMLLLLGKAAPLCKRRFSTPVPVVVGFPLPPILSPCMRLCPDIPCDTVPETLSLAESERGW